MIKHLKRNLYYTLYYNLNALFLIDVFEVLHHINKVHLFFPKAHLERISRLRVPDLEQFGLGNRSGSFLGCA
jgi:hypothetical protein